MPVLMAKAESAAATPRPRKTCSKEDANARPVSPLHPSSLSSQKQVPPHSLVSALMPSQWQLMRQGSAHHRWVDAWPESRHVAGFSTAFCSGWPTNSQQNKWRWRKYRRATKWWVWLMDEFEVTLTWLISVWLRDDPAGYA